MNIRIYEWMVEYTPQTLWIERRGLLVWLAEVCGILGGGLYLVGLYFADFRSMLIGLIIVALLKGGLHLAHLGRPLRFWRLILKPSTSWMARGFLFVGLFIILGALQLLVSQWWPQAPVQTVLKAASGLAAFFVVVYAGFVMNYIRGIPLWNSGMLPLLFASLGLTGGMGLFAIMEYFSGLDSFGSIWIAFRWFSVANIILVVTFLWSAAYAGPTSRHSLGEMVKGQAASILWIGVVVCGLAVPFVISFSNYLSGGASPLLLIVLAISVLIGVFSFTYCLLKGARYAPIV